MAFVHPRYLFCLNSLILLSFFSTPIKAQVVEDATVFTRVTTNNNLDFEVHEGILKGNNLFHSFQEFSIPDSGSVIFNSADVIDRIIARVTGDEASNINGLIQIDSNADLFLINPNGIIFGSKAALNIGGSFLATTASSITFVDGTHFNTAATQTEAVLSVRAPLGLQFGNTAGEIINQSRAPLMDRNTGNFILDPETNNEIPAGLQVPLNQTIALIGGTVSLVNGFLTAPSGHIEIGSVGDGGFTQIISSEEGFSLDYENTTSFRNISIFGSLLNISGEYSGSIQIQGKNIVFSKESQTVSIGESSGDIFIQGQQVSFLDGSSVVNVASSDQAGNIAIKSDQIELVGAVPVYFSDGSIGWASSGLINDVEGTASGEGSILSIEAQRLIIRDGAQVSTATFGAGQGVDLNVTTSESVELLGTALLNPEVTSGLFARVREGATGSGGTIQISTQRLVAQGGGQVSTDTLSRGNAGDVEIAASDLVNLVGRSADNPEVASGISTQVRPISTSDRMGDAGDLSINTLNLLVTGGAQVLTAARGDGRGGWLTIDADSVLLSGSAPISGEANRSGLFVSAEEGATRDAGNLLLTAQQLTIADGARISADNFGSGPRGGNATLNVNQLVLRDGGEIKATTLSGEGGNLVFDNLDLLLLQNRSTITTRASNDANGGNIVINAPSGFVIASPGVDSDIVASAQAGNGGRITITTQGLFGLEEVERQQSMLGNGRNELDTSSEFGIEGTITIIQPDVDPSRGLTVLPANLVDPSRLIAQSCPGRGGAIAQSLSNFTVTGRGGLPASPADPRVTDAVLTDWATLNSGSVTASPSREAGDRVANRSEPSTPAIVEAQGWLANANGSIMLVAQVPTATPHQAGFSPVHCGG